MMTVKRVECRKCGRRFSLTVPDKMSAVGIRILSVCSACLVGAQPLNEGDPEPIYRFPGGDSLVDKAELRNLAAENERSDP